MKKLILILSLATFSLFSTLALAQAEPTSLPKTEQTKVNPINKSVNINKATIEQLSTLKGISKVKAQAIINYRTNNGKFTQLEDLLNVKGIGEKILQNNKSRLSIK